MELTAESATCIQSLLEAEFEHMVDVVASDQKLQQDRLIELKLKELSVHEVKRRRDAIVTGSNFNRTSVCSLCCTPFSIFVWGSNCPICGHRTCKQCRNQVGAVCKLCETERDMRLQAEEWRVLCPFSGNAFGLSKLLALDSLNIIDQVSGRPRVNWKRRARLELLISSVITCSLDTSPVDICLSSLQVREVKRRLADECTLFSPDRKNSLLSCLRELQDAVSNARKMDGSFEMTEAMISEDYPELLSTAVMSTLILIERTKPMFPRGSSSASTQTDSPLEDNRGTVFYEDVKSKLDGRQDADNGNDSAVEDVDDLCSNPTGTLGKNWFFKNTHTMNGIGDSPFGSMRSQRASRIPLSMNLFAQSFSHSSDDVSGGDDPTSVNRHATIANLPESFLPTTSFQTNNGFADSQQKELANRMNVLDDDDGVLVAVKEGDEPSFQQEPLSRSVASGDKVTFTTIVKGLEPIDVYWYNSSKEIVDQGRFRISSKGHVHKLEIFDVDLADAGEYVCLAVNEISVASCIALLSVADADIAGEEPMFVAGLYNTVFKQGEVIKLHCKVFGYPVPRVTFHKNNCVLHQDNRTTIDHTDSGGKWVLEVEDAQVSDSGQYTAMATNRISKAISRSAISILPNASKASSATSGDSYPRHHKASSGHGHNLYFSQSLERKELRGPPKMGTQSSPSPTQRRVTKARRKDGKDDEVIDEV